MSERPNLAHALVERLNEHTGVLVTANGFAMGVFNVDMEDDDETGLIYAPLLRYAASKRGRGLPFYGVRIKGEYVEMGDGSLHRRERFGNEVRREYPNWRKIPGQFFKTYADAEGLRAIAVSPKLLRSVSDAFGWPICAVTFSKEMSGPVLIRGCGGPVIDSPDLAPYAILMPMHSPSLNEQVARVQVAVG